MIDIVNAAFELLGGVFVAISCARLYRDKCVRGVSPWQAAFFLLWGVWNLVFYPAVGAWISFAGGLLIVCTNFLWLALMLRYRNEGKNNEWQI